MITVTVTVRVGVRVRVRDRVSVRSIVTPLDHHTNEGQCGAGYPTSLPLS